jgi:predicted nucleotidyltransferase
MTQTYTAMSLAYREYLEVALERVDIAPDAAIVLEGSLAEGFGNGTSDLDFLAVEAGDRPTPLVPVIVFHNDRRVELRVRSKREVQAELFKVLSGGSSDEESAGEERVTFDELDRIQRFFRSVVYRSSDTLVELKSQLSEEILCDVTSQWFRALMHRSLRCAVALEALQQWDAAAQWYRTAVEQGSKLWLCARGETYLSLKWIGQQFARVIDCDRDEVTAGFATLTGSVPRGPHAREYVGACRSFLVSLGFDTEMFDEAQVQLTQIRSVTSWRIGDRVHVVRDRAEMYALSDAAMSVWRSIDFGVSAAELVKSTDVTPAEAGWFIAEFHRLGFVDLRWGDGSEIVGRTRSLAVASRARPVLSIQGAVAPSDATGIEFVPLPPAHFAAAGIGLVWANIEVENSREDALGALAAGQWGTLEYALRRIVRKCAVVVLCAYGMVSLASVTGGLGASSWQRREADEEACLRLRAIPGLPAGLLEEVLDFEARISITDESQGNDALARADAIARCVREITLGSIFPSSFVSSREWRETLELFYDWIRLAAYLDATFPLDEARDLVAVGNR